ncbi:DNA repair protein RAD51 4 [Amphibalanus amphitrite]|uniref:DNA repair protein RAD51 4 n=1 Tax=Amphibalanus amphitrite TaxID=1232801 RepID=A0A6A4V3B9_AMPAM|nr:DNA repair protein RAD51 homolog 4-like isoform X1 [Amphibalanus amphitrite]KAF0289136.1 DNA repair protein RAD51 4 [Amphibalanus amphitrite]KAF0289137.1 DNA repair protein RAD51 4 [Amphibalanus amphitrite]
MHQYLKNKECPLLSEDVLAELKNNGIKTVLAFLSRDSEALIHACSLTYQEVVSVKKVLFAKYSALPCSATDLLDQPSVAPLASGCDRVDGLLGGGLPAGDLVELCGPSAVGKTQLCLAWAAAALLAGARVLVADAKCEFSVARCRRLLRRRGRSAQECDRLLERLQYAQVFSMQELLALLEAVRSRRRLHAGLRLLVVDSLAALAAPLLASPGFIGFGLLTDVGTTLKSVAAECRLTALVTNDLVQSEPGGGERPALGLAWLHVPHHRLLLSRETSTAPGPLAQPPRAGPRRTATLAKSISAPCGTSADFLVTGAGVEEAPTAQKRSAPED